MKLIVLAAGRGRRLRPLTDDRPKPTVQLQNGKSIIEESINNLQDGIGFDEVVVVSGYEYKKLAGVVENINGVGIDVIHNPFYADAGPVISLWAVTHEIWANDVVIINGDTVYFEESSNCFPENGSGIYLGYSHTEDVAEDEMKVVSNPSQDILSKVEKDMSSGWDGVSSGLVHISGEEHRRAVVNTITQAAMQDLWMPWHNLLNIIRSTGVAVKLKETPYNSWCEIDTMGDLEIANDLVIGRKNR